MVRIEERFAELFAEAWKRPTPERLVALLHPDVVLWRPPKPPIHGKEAALKEFERLLGWLPDLCGEVECFRGDDHVVFIEWLMKFPIGRKGVQIRAVDRFTLAGGLGIERAAYLDPVPLTVPVGIRPHHWFGFFRYYYGHLFEPRRPPP